MYVVYRYVGVEVYRCVVLTQGSGQRKPSKFIVNARTVLWQGKIFLHVV